jgi:hypothetical protein
LFLELAIHKGLMESDDEAYEDLGDDFDIMAELNEGAAAVKKEGEEEEVTEEAGPN